MQLLQQWTSFCSAYPCSDLGSNCAGLLISTGEWWWCTTGSRLSSINNGATSSVSGKPGIHIDMLCSNHLAWPSHCPDGTHSVGRTCVSENANCFCFMVSCRVWPSTETARNWLASCSMRRQSSASGKCSCDRGQKKPRHCAKDSPLGRSVVRLSRAKHRQQAGRA